MKERKQGSNFYIVDCTNKSLGRVASEIALILQGKNKPDYFPHKDSGATVLVRNSDKIKFTGNKLKNKFYFRFTGYLGNLKKISLEEMLKKRGIAHVIKLAVKGMLPKNRLQANRLKRIRFE